MSSKKAHHPIEKPLSETPAEASGRPASEPRPEVRAEGSGPETVPAVTMDGTEALKKQLAEVQAQADEYKDGWQRAVADFSNYRKRLDRENDQVYQSAVAGIVRRYLPIIDDMERALAARPADLAWAEGIELIYRKLQAILDAEGVKRIGAEGQMFDPNFHEAIAQEPSEGLESGRIIAVVQNGYMLGERVIRPAVVRVAK